DDPEARAALPETQIEPAAADSELTPGTGVSDPALFRTWQRSHGDNTSARFSGLDQINRSNVQQLEVAWTYHSQDGRGNIQCNPIVVDGLMFVPTPGNCVVGVDAATGAEVWRFKPELSGVKAGLADAPAR